MSYYDNHDNRDYREPYGRRSGYSADYYEGNPINPSRDARRDYGSRQSRRPRQEFRRRASSVGGDPSYNLENRSQWDQSRPYEGSYSHRAEYDSSSDSGRSSRHRNRRKSTGGARDDRDDRYRRRGDRRDESRDESEDEGHDDSSHDRGWSDRLRDKGGDLIMQAALPLLAAGAAEALRSRKQPGQWRGDKGKSVAKAAVTHGLLNKDPNKPHAHHILDTTASGLKEGRPSREELAEIQRRASKNRTLSNAKKVAAAGALVFAGKEIYDRYERSRSQKRSQGYDYSSSDLKRSQSLSHDSDRRRYPLGHEESDYPRLENSYGDDPSDHGQSYYGRDRDYRSRYYPSDEY